MSIELEVFSRPPSAESHHIYSQRFQAFSGALRSTTALNAGVRTSLSFRIGKTFTGANYLLRTGEIKELDGPMMHLALDSSRRSVCCPCYPGAGARLEFNLLYDPNSTIMSKMTPLTQTALVADHNKELKAEKMKQELEEIKNEINEHEKKIRDLTKQIYEALDIPHPTKEDQLYIQNLINEKINITYKLKKEKVILTQKKKKLLDFELIGKVTHTLPMFMFGDKPCIWLNEQEILKKIDKTMLCWSLEIVDCAKPIDRTNSHNNYGKATATQNQYHQLLKQDCTEEEWAMVVPVKLSEEDGYEKATPILDRQVNEPEM